MKEEQMISTFLEALGPWKEHVVIGGGFAPIIYQLYFSTFKSKHPPIGTRDIDTLIPRRIPNVSKKGIDQHLLDAEFTHIFKDHSIPATEAYMKEIEGQEIEIEFLTDTCSRKNKYSNVQIAGIVAQPLSYLTLSLQKTLPFTTQSGKCGLVVSPDAWIFHKGLTFNRRKESSKAYKDFYGIWYVSSQLRDFSDHTMSQVFFLKNDHPKWFKTFTHNLRHWIEMASPKDWSNLETQDPLGKLKKLHFTKLIKRWL